MQRPLVRLALKGLAMMLAAGGPAQQAAAQSSEAPAASAGAEVDVAAANRDFGIGLYRELAAEPGNLFLSPIGIVGAFGPALAGASGETRDGIAGALHLPAGETPALHKDLGQLLGGIERQQDGATLSIANALWVQDGFALKPGFLRIAREDYGATAEPVDFARSADAAARINAWSNEETRGRIAQLFPPNAFNHLTRLVVTNVVYFLGQWADAFPVSATQPQPFHRPGGDARPAPMMHNHGNYRQLWTESFAAIDLPYKDDRLSMTVFLPNDRDGLAAFEAGLGGDALSDWLRRLDASGPSKVDLYLPRFEIRESYQLAKPLAAMGMASAFMPDKADFSGIADTELFISEVVHKTYVRVDEKGTEAVAATGLTVMTTSMPTPFRADHPFFFLLRDKPTGTILFMGRIVDPTPP